MQYNERENKVYKLLWERGRVESAGYLTKEHVISAINYWIKNRKNWAYIEIFNAKTGKKDVVFEPENARTPISAIFV